jgi:hypothetical protein
VLDARPPELPTATNSRTVRHAGSELLEEGLHRINSCGI